MLKFNCRTKVRSGIEKLNYNGRIAVTLFVIISSLVMWIIGNQPLSYFYLIFSICFLSIGWWFGKQYDKVKFYCDKDELTKTYNRRFVMGIAPKLLLLAKRKNKKLSVSIIDVDNFKSINDLYGHQMGDRVLRDISDSLVKVTRENDIIARWGGDEFLIISPLIKTRNPKLIIQRIEHQLNLVSQQYNVNVSVSIGTAIYPDDGTSFNKLINEADRNMYFFKSTQKNNHLKIN
jgi:diguanylate cyclase (GGDEF)-like protein